MEPLLNSPRFTLSASIPDGLRAKFQLPLSGWKHPINALLLRRGMTPEEPQLDDGIVRRF